MADQVFYRSYLYRQHFRLQSFASLCFTLISTSYLARLFDIFILLHISQNCVCFGDFLSMRTLCDAYHEEFESHKRSKKTVKRNDLLALALICELFNFDYVYMYSKVMLEGHLYGGPLFS